jgi:transposase
MLRVLDEIPGRSGGAASSYKNPLSSADISPHPPDQALGRSRGGLSSKLHLAVDGRGLPLAVLLTAGQAGDNPQLLPLLDAIAVPRRGRGRPRSRPAHLIADKGYSHPSTRAALRRRGIAHSIPEKSDHLALRRRRGSRGGRPPHFDAEIYKRRNVVERCINRLKQWRGIATRYDKKASNYRGGVLLGALVLWTRA